MWPYCGNQHRPGTSEPVVVLLFRGDVVFVVLFHKLIRIRYVASCHASSEPQTSLIAGGGLCAGHNSVKLRVMLRCVCHLRSGHCRMQVRCQNSFPCRREDSRQFVSEDVSYSRGVLCVGGKDRSTRRRASSVAMIASVGLGDACLSRA